MCISRPAKFRGLSWYARIGPDPTRGLHSIEKKGCHVTMACTTRVVGGCMHTKCSLSLVHLFKVFSFYSSCCCFCYRLIAVDCIYYLMSIIEMQLIS